MVGVHSAPPRRSPAPPLCMRCDRSGHICVGCALREGTTRIDAQHTRLRSASYLAWAIETLVGSRVPAPDTAACFSTEAESTLVRTTLVDLFIGAVVRDDDNGLLTPHWHDVYLQIPQRHAAMLQARRH